MLRATAGRLTSRPTVPTLNGDVYVKSTIAKVEYNYASFIFIGSRRCAASAAKTVAGRPLSNYDFSSLELLYETDVKMSIRFVCK